MRAINGSTEPDSAYYVDLMLLLDEEPEHIGNY